MHTPKKSLLLFRTRLILFLIQFCSSLLNSQTYTFTTASATGTAGPTQSQINTAYLSTNLNGSVIVTGGIQSWTVPATGLYRIETRGAKGGNGYAPTGTPLKVLAGGFKDHSVPR